MTSIFYNRHRSDEQRDVEEPIDDCKICQRGIYDSTRLIQTATGSVICENCIDELLDGECAICHGRVLLCEYAEHLIQEHEWDEADAEWEADAHEVSHG